MNHIIDARGLSCPQPVINTKKALELNDSVIAIVDNQAALENITRMARHEGITFSAETKADGIYITLQKTTETRQQPGTETAGKRVLVMSQDVLGKGDDELGRILVRSFFHTIAETLPAPDVIVFMNSGVKLVSENSPVLDDILALEKQGVRILACGTCLDFFGLKEKRAAGTVSNMYEIKELMLTAASTINL